MTEKSYIIVEEFAEQSQPCKRIYDGEGEIHNWEELVGGKVGKSPDKDSYRITSFEICGSFLSLNTRVAEKVPKVNWRGLQTGQHKYNLKKIGSFHITLDETQINFLEQLLTFAKKPTE